MTVIIDESKYTKSDKKISHGESGALSALNSMGYSYLSAKESKTGRPFGV